MGRTKGESSSPILVVDDSIIMQNLILDMFKDNNITSVDTANDGAEALDMVTSKKYSLIIMDILMPNMDGITAIEHIKKIKPEMPIIVLTALHNNRIKKRCQELGVKEYVTKPFHSQKLITMIMKYI